MADFSNIPNFHLKLVFVVHFLLLSMSLLGRWAPLSYVFYNIVLMVILIWGMHKTDTDEPIQTIIFINGVSIILDVIVIAMRFPDSHEGSERFSAAMAIINLIARPLTTIFLAKFLQDRSVVMGGNIGNFFTGPRNRSYEDMDKNAGPHVPSPTANQGGYDFATAQQI